MRSTSSESREDYHGVFPIAPTPFSDKGELDLSSQRRVLDCMIDQGIDGICILANYSEQFALSDEERDVLLDVCLDHVAGRVPVIVACSHFSTQIAAARACRAQDAGAAMVMVMPPYHGTVLQADAEGVVEHFSRVATQISIPIMLQDAPLSGVTLSVDLLVRLANELPQLSYFKIEMPGTADKLRSLIKLGRGAIVGPFDGEEGITLLADLDAGATGTMPSALIPDLIKSVVEQYRDGHRDQAEAEYALLLPTINFENRQCGLQGTKAVMKEAGIIQSDFVRHPLRLMRQDVKEALLSLLRSIDPVILNWAR